MEINGSKELFAIAKCLLFSAVGVFLILVFMKEFAGATNEKDGIIPEKEIQAQIDRVFSAKNDAALLNKELERLRQLSGDGFEKLVPQLIYYSMHGDDIYEANALLVMMDKLKIPPYALLTGVLPYLGTKEPILKKEVYEVLSIVENGYTPGNPDFSHYDSLLRVRKDNPPEELVKYMFQKSPGTALLSMARIYSKDRKPILWAEHVISDVLWQQEHGFMDKNHAAPEAVKQLERLSVHPEWWARLYVVEIVRAHPEFKTKEILSAFEKESHPIVRGVLDQMPKEKAG